MKNLIKIFSLVALLVSSVFIFGCDELEPSSRDLDLNNFNSESEFKAFLENVQQTNQNDFLRSGTEASAAFEVADFSESSPVAKDSSSLDYSETNVQVEGVDELDIIKTDGDFIYTSSNKDVFIIDAYPARDAEIVSSLNLKNTVSGLFIYDDLLVVSGRVDDIEEFESLGLSSRNALTFLNIYDVSDRENPVLLEEFRFDGSYFNARLFEGVVYLSTNYNPFNRPHPLPIIVQGGVSRTMPVSDIYLFDTDYSNPSFVSVHSINLVTQENVDSKIFTLDGSNHLYMSYDNIYLTFQERTNRYELQQEFTIDKVTPMLPSEDRDLIDRINSVDDDILNKFEKQSKIMRVIHNYISYLDQAEQDDLREEIELLVKEELKRREYLEHTIIHKIGVNDGELEFKASNKVPGYIYGQFALDEHEGILRVATTIRQGMHVTDEYPGFDWQSRSPSVNNVYTLDEDMNLLGKLEGSAPTESIYSARYVDDRLYMVTFRQIDPFFVIDLSDPENPEDLGELKITGYSRYLHPFDENTIIGLGREGTETGRIQGIKISLFDVSDVENPDEIVTYVSDDVRSSSGAEWEHKAFLFSKEKELLVIPAQNHDWQNPENNYAGALVFKINKEEISPRGIITHSQGSAMRGGVERSLYIEDELYTKSENLLRINNLETLRSTKNLTLSTRVQETIPRY